MNFRPSLLPKLAACPVYQPEGDAGAAAARGTEMDDVFRSHISEDTPQFNTLTHDDHAAVWWAIDTAKILAGGNPLEARELHLKIHCEGMEGTADLLCEDGGWSADLKSGQVRNYLEQQACYALGFMDRFWRDEWVVYLFYCDQREVVTLRYTRDEAQEIIRKVKAAALDEHAQAKPCDYCGWCAKRWRCPTRLESVAWFLGLDPRTVDLTAHATDPQALAQSLDLTHEIQKDGGVHEFLKGAAKVHVTEGRVVPGWKLQNGRETKTVPALMLQAQFKGKTLLQLCGTQATMAACGNITGDKFSALWASAFGEDPIPLGTITINHGAPFLAKDRKKKP